MIAEAVDTLWTLGWALAAWIAVLAMVASIVLLAGTAVGMWAIRGAWRVLRGRVSASGPAKAAGEGHGDSSASEGRLWLSEADTSAETAPYARRGRCWSASQGASGGFHEPRLQTPTDVHTRPRTPSWANTQPIKEN